MGDDHDVALATRRPAPQRALLGKRGAQPASGSTRSLRTGCLGRPNRYVASRLGGRKLGWRPPAPLTTGGHRSGEVPAGGYHHGSSSILVNWPWRLPLAVGVRPTAACSAPRTRHGAASARGIAPIRDRHRQKRGRPTITWRGIRSRPLRTGSTCCRTCLRYAAACTPVDEIPRRFCRAGEDRARLRAALPRAAQPMAILLAYAAALPVCQTRRARRRGAHSRFGAAALEGW